MFSSVLHRNVNSIHILISLRFFEKFKRLGRIHVELNIVHDETITRSDKLITAKIAFSNITEMRKSE